MFESADLHLLPGGSPPPVAIQLSGSFRCCINKPQTLSRACWVLSGASVGELELNLTVMEVVSAVKFNCEHDEQKLQARVGLEFWNERRLPETRHTRKWPVFSA